MASATGAVVENLSNRKLFAILSCLLLAQIVFFLLGGLVAPKPSSAMPHAMRTCEDVRLGSTGDWFYFRPSPKCEEIQDFGDEAHPHHLKTGDPREIVFVAQMPHMRDGHVLEYSPWFQTVLGLLSVDVEHTDTPPWTLGKDPEMMFQVRMGYQKHGDPPDLWRELTSTTITRKLECTIHHNQDSSERQSYHCAPMELFELGSSDYPFYLLNIRMPGCNQTASKYNCDIGRVVGLEVVEIHQNGGFTKVWLSMKTLLAPCVILGSVWYWKRIRLLNRRPYLLEKAIFALGVTTSAMDFPVEWLSLVIRMPFMLLLSDIRQGIFYAVLFSFWLIFTEEHLIDEGIKNRLSNYWKHLTPVLFAFTCMFIFDMCERGVHLNNPFYSIWATKFGTNLAYGFVVLAALSAGIYFLVLFYYICRVIGTIKRKRATLLHMNENRRLKIEGVIYRFKFLMLLTMVCAGFTVAGFIMEQVGEGQLRWGDYRVAPDINYTSAFLTGVFGMWNIYILLLLAMYAPSHKEYSRAAQLPSLDEDDEDDVMMDGNDLAEASSMTMFVKPPKEN